MLFHPTSHLPRNSHSFTDWHFSLSGVVFHYVSKLYRSVYSSWMYIFSVSCFCSCYHLDFPLCRTFDFSHVIVKSCQIYFRENPHSKPAPITQTHTPVPLPCVCIFCKRWMCEKQRLYGGREMRMRMLCEFSAALWIQCCWILCKLKVNHSGGCCGVCYGNLFECWLYAADCRIKG